MAHQGPAGLVVLGNVVVVGVVGILHITLTHLKAGVTGVLGMFMSTAGLLGGGDSLDEDDRAGLEGPAPEHESAAAKGRASTELDCDGG